MIDARAEIAERSSDGSARGAKAREGEFRGTFPVGLQTWVETGQQLRQSGAAFRFVLPQPWPGACGEIRGRVGTPSTARVETKLHAHVFVLTW
jgi:hypothetical protein